MKKYILAFLLFFTGTVVADGPKVGNYIGDGKSPRIHLKLSKNSPNWGSYTIDYKGQANIPYDKNNPKYNQWSTWDIFDTANNYYGTITLGSNASATWWKGYKPPAQSQYVIKNCNGKVSGMDYFISITGTPESGGPFPNTPRATPAVNASGNPVVLSVDSDKVVDEHVTEIKLKGIVRSSLEWNPQGQYLSPHDIDLIASWGANVIRLDLNQQYWTDSQPVTTKGSYKQIIDAIIYESIKNKMAIILDLHWTKAEGGQPPMADRDSIAFWKDVAESYKNFGTVMFELFNEPYVTDQNIWLNGNSQYSGYQELYNAVRSTGAENIVIVAGMDYGYRLDFVTPNFEVKGSNIIYCSHPYDNKGYKTPNFSDNFKGIQGRYPIIFTEFGDNQQSDFPPASDAYKALYTKYLEYINANGIHYCGFEWFVDHTWAPSLISDWNGTPQSAGILIKADLKTNPPTPISD